jgi:hypothetical protein
MNKNKIEDIIGEEGKNDLADLMSDNDDNMEHNRELFNKNWNSVLNIEPEDKYLSLFKECLKQKYYNNHKKDGSLRIFSSKQRNKKSESSNNENNPNYLNIFNYFRNNDRNEVEDINFKTIHSFWSRRRDYLYITEGLPNYIQNERIKSAEIKFNLTKMMLTKNNEIIIQDNEEIINKDEQSTNNNNKEKTSALMNYSNLKDKYVKIDKKLLYGNNLIKDNTKENSINKNKYGTIRFQKDLINSKKYFLQEDFNNKKSNRIEKQLSELISPDKKNTKNKKNSLKEYINDRQIFYRNKTILQENKNTDSFFNNLQEGKMYDKVDILKSIQHINNQNKNCMQLLKIPFISDRESRKIIFPNDINSINKLKNISFTKKGLNNNREYNLFPVNQKTKKFLSTLYKGHQSTHNMSYFKNIKNNSFNKNKNEFISHNYTLRNKKAHNSIKVNDHKSIYQQLNGFSVSYFEKIHPNNNKNNFELINKDRPFPSSLNIFKFSFDSGIYKIPLISSSVKLQKKKQK